MKKLNLKISDLWRWDGTIGREEYLLLGLVLFVIKYGIDRWVADAVFHRNWLPFNYLVPSENWGDPAQRGFGLTMVAMALPFVWTGIVLTLRRLRSVKLGFGWVLLFFVPFANLLLFFC